MHATTLITRADGRVIYPPVAPNVTREAAYRQLFAKPLVQTETARLSLAGKPYVVAASPLPDTGLV